MKHVYFYVALFSLICGVRADQTYTLQQSSPTSAQNIHSYFWFNYQRHGGNYKLAQTLFNKTVQPNAPIYAYKGYLQLLYQTENYATIVQLMPLLEQRFTQDQAIQLIFANALEKTGNNQKAQERIIQLNNRYPNNKEIALRAIQLYMNRKEPKNALLVIQEILQHAPTQPSLFIFHFLRAQIDLNLGNINDALTAVTKAVRLQPRFDAGWLLKGLLEERTGAPNDALQSYTTYIGLTGSNKELEQHILQLKHNKKISPQSHNTTNSIPNAQLLALFSYPQNAQICLFTQ